MATKNNSQILIFVGVLLVVAFAAALLLSGYLPTGKVISSVPRPSDSGAGEDESYRGLCGECSTDSVCVGAQPGAPCVHTLDDGAAALGTCVTTGICEAGKPSKGVGCSCIGVFTGKG